MPYTLWDLEKSATVDVWNLTGGPSRDYSKMNSQRFSAFHQLDLRDYKSFYLKKITAKFYIDIQNLYNFQAEQQHIVVRKTDENGNFLTRQRNKICFGKHPEYNLQGAANNWDNTCILGRLER